MTFEDQVFKSLSRNNEKKIECRILENKTKGYFFLKQEDFSNFVKARLKSLERSYDEVIGSNVSFKPLNNASTDYFFVFGMINIVDTNNIYLFSNINDNNEVLLKLNLEHIKKYSLFSGQVVAMKGKNLGNNEFVVESIHCIPTVEANTFKANDDCTLRIISGDVDEICLEGIDILILINVNITKHKIKLDNWVKEEKYRKIIIVPVLGDDHSINVYPQVMINDFGKNFELATNPVEIMLNNKLICINTLDILYELKKEEVTFCNKKTDQYFSQKDKDLCGDVLFSGDRIDRLCHHIIYQNSYMPVLMSGINVQYDSEALNMKVCPDIYILRSKLEPFRKKIGETEIFNIGNEHTIDIEIKKEI